ncbi:MAG: DMT family transporter [Planctomycetes bacterium]|nr:DMT family transporter [Planctomycetota bacterium]
MTPLARARLAAFAAALLFSTGGAAIKATALTSWQVASFRSGIAAIAVWLMVPAARRGWTRRTWLVSVAYAGTLSFFVAANKLTTAANTIFLQSTAPFYILLLGPWLLREPLRRRDVGFLAVVALGMASFFVGAEAPATTAPDPLRGNLYALASGVAWAFTVMGLRWLARDALPGAGAGTGAAAGVDTYGAATAAVIAGNVTAFLIGLPGALPVGATRGADWAVLAYLGVVQIGLAYVFLSAAVRRLAALETALLLVIEPCLSPLWAWLAHDERPGAWPLAGGALILGATTLRTWFESRPAAGEGAAVADRPAPSRAPAPAPTPSARDPVGS